jgi:hypothetical protein
LSYTSPDDLAALLALDAEARAVATQHCRALST